MDERPSARTGADIHHFRFEPSQPLKLHAGAGDGRLTVELPATSLKLDVDALDAERGTLSLKLPWSKRDQRLANGEGEGIPQDATSVIKVPADISKSLRERLEEQAMAWVHEHQAIPPAILQLLERQPLPALQQLNAAIAGDPNAVADALAGFLQEHSGISLALQGPPGTGKTTVTGQVIAQLVASGQRVAISSNGHAAINNLLKKAKSTCSAAGVAGEVVKCNNSKEEALSAAGISVVKPGQLTEAMAVVGGTTWMFCKEALADQFDWLVVDEAGQMSLANLLVMARCARSILLVGDQQQLAQPSQADHPGESGQSCLEYWMEGASVVPSDRGVFLSTSWRMEPSLTAMVSALFYEGRLQASSANCRNRIEWAKPCQGSCGQLYPGQGLLFDPVAHSGNSVCSEEEINRIEALVDSLLGGSYQHAKAGGIAEGTLTPDTILVTAPYNVHVNRLQQRLAGKARVGTVDKFQGQEAPVAIHSLTASSGDEAPRGLSFLLEPNRLNVAISRAQCLSIVVGSPSLASGIANTVADAEQINRLCRVIEGN